MSGKAIPPLEKIAPDIFMEDKQLSSDNYTDWTFEKFRAFSESYNRRHE